MENSASRTADFSGRSELKKIRDNLEYFARLVLQFKGDKLSALEKRNMDDAMRSLYKSYSAVEEFCDYYAVEIGAQKIEEHCQRIVEMMAGAFHIGALAVLTDFTRAQALKSQGNVARQKKSANVAIRKKDQLRPAIITVAKGNMSNLVASRKYAESITDSVRQIAGVSSKAKGFSARTIQREIKAILEARLHD